MALPTNADVIVVHGYWLDELTGVGVKQANGLPATIMFDPVPLLGANAAKTPNLRDLTSNAHLKTRTRVATVDPVTGYYAAQLVASNDPDLDAYSGRKVTFLGEDPFTIEVPYNAPTVTVSAEMAAKTGLTQGSSVKAIWLPNASVTTIPTPTPPTNYLSSSQTLANIAAGIETHDEDPDAHADIRAALATIPEQARDAVGAALVAGSGITVTVDDAANTITLTATGGGGSSYTDEQAQDAFAALVAAGTHSGISFTYDDAGNAISATVAAQSWSQITGKPTFAAVATSGSYTDLANKPVVPDSFTQPATKTADYTAADNEIVPLDTSGGTFTLTGPTSGKPFGFRWKAGTTAPTIAAPAGYTISGAASVTPGLAPSATSGELVLWQAFGTDYQPAGGFKGQSQLDARYPVLDGTGKVSAANTRLFNDRGLATTSTSTTYNPGDLVTYAGRRILITTQTTSTGFISAANYISLGKLATFSAYDYGFRADGNTATAAANTAALKAAITAASAVSGAVVELPYGFAYVAKDGANAWAVELLPNVALVGQGMKATQLVLAPSQNCTVIKMHTSTGSGNANAFYCAVTDMTIDGRKATQDSATALYHGIDSTTNPLTTQQSGDDGFDAHHFLHNLRIYTVAGSGVYLRGRSAIVCSNVFVWQAGNYGFDSSFDSRFEDCESMQSGLSGFRFANGQIQASNCKAYLSGQVDGTAGHGFLLQNTGLAVGTLAGCIAQNNYSAGFYFNGAWGWGVAGCAADTNNYYNSGANGWAGFHFDSTAKFNVVDGTSSQTGQSGAGQLGWQTNAVALLGGATQNEIRVSHYAGSAQTVGSVLSSGSTLLANRVSGNGANLSDTLAGLTDVSVTSPADGAAFVYSASTGKWIANAAAGTNFSLGAFGDGSDGAATLDGTATVAWASKSGSTYTMNRDANCTTLTISSGVQLNCSGFRIFCTVSLTNNGTMSADGNAGGATGTGGAATTNGTIGQGAVGSAGQTGAGTAGSNGGTLVVLGVGSGGAGGAGSSGAGGAQGFTGNSNSWMLRTPHGALSGAVGYAGAVKALSGAPSGGGGGGDGTNKGGGGGSGGGAIVVLAKAITNTGTLTARGGAGGTPTTGNCGGGGGGGGGLILLYSTTAWSNTGTTAVTGGTGGTAVGTGVNGSTGSTGTVNNFVIV